MKVIAIMGSPHKGNGYKIVQKIESRLKQISNIDFKYIFPSDINFKMCKGCFTCISKGEYLCPLKDDKDIKQNVEIFYKSMASISKETLPADFEYYSEKRIFL